jgi:hypothetical protein
VIVVALGSWPCPDHCSLQSVDQSIRGSYNKSEECSDIKIK